jgi:predicted GH43/DUF377 family glycosyl hydrolase
VQVSVYRSPKNPIIEPKDVKPSREDFEVVGVFNAGVTSFNDEIILLLRVAERPVTSRPNVILTAIYDTACGEIVTKEFPKNDPDNDFSDPRLIIRPGETYLTSISHLRLARSTDGIKFEIKESPAIAPANAYEVFGVEDPRITLIDGTYYITYVSVSPLGATTSLASTTDFLSFKRHGVIFCPENKDVTLLPERIGGKYYALHRPISPLFKRQDIWIAESPDLFCWGNHRYLCAPRKDAWDNKKVGAGAAPVKTEYGWLEIYHGAGQNDRYCLGAMLLDADRPWKVIARSHEPVLEPQADYETQGFFGNVVFSCGLLVEQDELRIYYGVADTSIAYAELPLQDVITRLEV